MKTQQPSIEQILELMKQQMGEAPETLVQLSEINPDFVVHHAMSKQFAMQEGNIPPKYKILIGLGAAAALGVPACINAYVQQALKAGINPEELVETLVLTRFVKGTSVISTAAEAIKMISEAQR